MYFRNLILLSCLLATVNISYARSPCMDAVLSILTGGNKKPTYSFQPFDESLIGKSLDQDSFIMIKENQLESASFKKYIKSNSHSRILLRETDNTESISEALNEWAKNPKIFFAVPEDRAGVKNIYNDSLSNIRSKDQRLKFYNHAEKQMKKARSNLSNDLAIRLSKSKTEKKYKDQVTNYIESSSDTGPVIIFAHNYNGKLHFPDGSTLAIDEFSKKVFEKERFPIVISCSTYKNSKGNSSNLLTSSNLLFEDFAISLNNASSALNSSSNDCLYVGDYLKIFDNTFITLSTKREVKVKFVLVALPVAGGTMLVGSVVIEEI